MPATTRQLSKIANVAEQTVRNYSREYAELLSPSARGETGARLFNDEDVQIFCTIATLRKAGVPPAEVIERIRRGDVYIDATTDHTKPHQAAQDATNGPQTPQDAPQALLISHNSLQRQIDALQRGQEARRRADMLWHIGTGIWIGIILMAAIFFAVGQLNGWWWWSGL